MEIKPVAYFRSPLKEKFGIPRQAGLVPELAGRVEFEPAYSSPEALRGLEGFDYIWLLWGFNLNPEEKEFKATVRPPRLGGNERVGVFASRSPFRPNAIGLSSVKLVSVENGALIVSGADLADGTPIYDIKPYVEYTDAHTGVRSGFVDEKNWKKLEVVFPDGFPIQGEEREALKGVLEQDPRPQYQEDPQRIYGMNFNGEDIHFKVTEDKLMIL